MAQTASLGVKRDLLDLRANETFDDSWICPSPASLAAASAAAATATAAAAAAAAAGTPTGPPPKKRRMSDRLAASAAAAVASEIYHPLSPAGHVCPSPPVLRDQDDIRIDAAASTRTCRRTLGPSRDSASNSGYSSVRSTSVEPIDLDEGVPLHHLFAGEPTSMLLHPALSWRAEMEPCCAACHTQLRVPLAQDLVGMCLRQPYVGADETETELATIFKLARQYHADLIAGYGGESVTAVHRHTITTMMMELSDLHVTRPEVLSQATNWLDRIAARRPLRNDEYLLCGLVCWYMSYKDVHKSDVRLSLRQLMDLTAPVMCMPGVLNLRAALKMEGLIISRLDGGRLGAANLFVALNHVVPLFAVPYDCIEMLAELVSDIAMHAFRSIAVQHHRLPVVALAVVQCAFEYMPQDLFRYCLDGLHAVRSCLPADELPESQLTQCVSLLQNELGTCSTFQLRYADCTSPTSAAAYSEAAGSTVSSPRIVPQMHLNDSGNEADDSGMDDYY